MSSIKLSSNYQVVVPKEVRQKLNLKKGQRLYVKSIGKDSVSFTTQSPVDKYRGILKGVYPDDVVAYQRELRQDRQLAEL